MEDLKVCGGVEYKKRVFGKFFDNIDGCLTFMGQNGVIASGSAVLHGLLPEADWEPNDLDMYVGGVSAREGKNWLIPWIDFLRSEGYYMEFVGERVRRAFYGNPQVWLVLFSLVFLFADFGVVFCF